jgi:putative membrane protein
MKASTMVALILGTALFAALLLHFGVMDIVSGVAAAGWGLVCACLYRFVPLYVNGRGWMALFAGAGPPASLWFRARWAGEAINSLLPVGQVGGEVARGQMVARSSAAPAFAGATVVVDMTVGLVTQFFFAALGVALLAPWVVDQGQTHSFVTGLVLAALGLAGFFLLQRSNLLGRLAERISRSQSGAWSGFTGGFSEVNRQVALLYGERRHLAACFAWRMLGWLSMTAETWLVLQFLGKPISLPNALVLESLSQAIRSAAFASPGGLGVQEAGFVLLGPMAGVGAETALTLAVIKRLREVLVGVPGLWVWAASERRRFSSLLGRKGPAR